MAADFIMTGVPEFRAAITAMATRAALAATEAVAEGAHAIEAEAKANFEGSHAKGQPHVGGDKPNVVTGNLRRSIHVEGPVAAGALGAKASVGPSMIYGRRVELGYRGSQGYPYFQPAVDKVTPDFAAIAARHWGVALHLI